VAVNAVQRYLTDRVKQPPNPTPSPFRGGGGDSGGGGGGAPGGAPATGARDTGVALGRRGYDRLAANFAALGAAY
jgi:hypothetical protein